MSEDSPRDRVRIYRVLEGIPQHELAKILGVSQATLSRIETGASHPSEELLQKLAAALSLPPSK